MADDPASDRSDAVCWCCGETRRDDDLVRLGCHPEVALCDTCVGWLAQQRSSGGLRAAVPILATADLTRALAHYRALGFEADGWEGGGYGFLHRDGVELHVGEVDGLDPTRNTASVYLHVADADRLHAEWAAAAVEGRLEAPGDTDYGLREGHHVDPDGNIIRFGSPMPDPASGDAAGALAGDDPLAVAATTATSPTGCDHRAPRLPGSSPPDPRAVSLG